MNDERQAKLERIVSSMKDDDKAFLARLVAPPPPPPPPPSASEMPRSPTRKERLEHLAKSLTADDLRFLSDTKHGIERISWAERPTWADILSNVRGCYLIVHSDGSTDFVPFDKAIHGRSHGKRVVVINEMVYVINPDRFIRRTRYPIFGSRKYPRVTYYGVFRENSPEQINLALTETPDVTGAVVGSIINDKIIKDIMNPEKDFRPVLYLILGAVVGAMGAGLYFFSQK